MLSWNTFTHFIRHGYNQFTPLDCLANMENTLSCIHHSSEKLDLIQVNGHWAREGPKKSRSLHPKDRNGIRKTSPCWGQYWTRKLPKDPNDTGEDLVAWQHFGQRLLRFDSPSQIFYFFGSRGLPFFSGRSTPCYSQKDTLYQRFEHSNFVYKNLPCDTYRKLYSSL